MATVWVFSLLWGLGAAGGELKAREIRKHWHKPATNVTNDSPQDEAENLFAGKMRATWIKRSWYRDLPTGRTLTPKGAVKSESVVLFELDAARLRFGWWERQDFPSGETEYELKVWRRGHEPDVFLLRIGLAQPIEDLEQFLKESRELKDHDKSPSDDELLVELDFAGRRFSVPVSEWTGGLVLENDRQWLTTAVTPAMREALETVRFVAEREFQLMIPCVYVIHPLLGLAGGEGECTSPMERSFVYYSGVPDCDFDDLFGEACTLRQRMEYRDRKAPKEQ